MIGSPSGLPKRPLLSAALTFALAVGAAAQQGGMMKEAIQEKLAAIKQSAAANKAALRQYAWTETVQVALNGQVKSTKQMTCRYGADGQVVRTPIGPPAPEQKTGPLRRRVVEEKKEELGEYMGGVRAVVGLYVPPDGPKMEQSFQAGNVSIDRPGAGEAGMVFKNYAKPGDSMTLDFAMATKKLATLNVASYMDSPSQPVSLAVQFASLPDGTNYPANVVLNAPAKGMQVTMTNAGYQKVGP